MNFQKSSQSSIIRRRIFYFQLNLHPIRRRRRIRRIPYSYSVWIGKRQEWQKWKFWIFWLVHFRFAEIVDCYSVASISSHFSSFKLDLQFYGFPFFSTNFAYPIISHEQLEVSNQLVLVSFSYFFTFHSLSAHKRVPKKAKARKTHDHNRICLTTYEYFFIILKTEVFISNMVLTQIVAFWLETSEELKELWGGTETSSFKLPVLKNWKNQYTGLESKKYIYSKIIENFLM